MDVSPVLVADLQAPEAVEPGERPFDHRSSGAIRAQNASDNSSFAMAPYSMAPILLPWLLTRRFC